MYDALPSSFYLNLLAALVAMSVTTMDWATRFLVQIVLCGLTLIQRGWFLQESIEPFSPR